MYEKIMIPAKGIDVKYDVDVLVAGGGPAGIGAAVSAARQGLSVLLVENMAFLGGNITACYVETCNHYMFKRPKPPTLDKEASEDFENGNVIDATGIYAEIESKYEAVFGRSDDIREDFPAFRFSSEYLKVFLDEFVTGENVKVMYHTNVNDVIVGNDHITGAVLHGKSGYMGVKAKVFIDSTGDGDVAYMAGVPFEKGSDKFKVCQPGTVNFRVTGVDVEKVNQNGGLLNI